MAAPPAVVSSAQGCSSGNCGSGCDTCCDSGGGWFGGGRLRGLFHRNSCDTCNTCDTCSGGGHWGSRFSGFGGFGHHNSCNTCNTSCNTCDSGCGSSSWFGGGRLKGLFHRNNSCCDTCDGGCNSCGGGTMGAPIPTPAPAPVGGEQLVNPPKKMPTSPAPAPAPAQKQVRINNAPVTTSPVVPNTPNIEVVPPPVPTLEAERRDPPF